MKFRKYLGLFICLFISGCISQPPRVAVDNKILKSPSIVDLLQDYQHYNTLSEHDLRIKQAEIKAKAAIPPRSHADVLNNQIIKLQLILIYLADKANPPDFTQIGKLLTDIDQQETIAGDAIQGFIKLLRTFIGEQKKIRMKLVGQHNKLQTQIHKNEVLEQKLLNSQQQAEALAKKIEQIKKIERIMSERQDNKIVK